MESRYQHLGILIGARACLESDFATARRILMP
jgi:hypothetical protein